MILEEHMKNTIKENYLNNIYSLTVPTTLLDWGVPDRAYQGRSFIPPVNRIHRFRTIGHTVRSAHSDGLSRYWEVGLLYRCKRVAFINNHITNYHPLESAKDAWKTTRGFLYWGQI